MRKQSVAKKTKKSIGFNDLNDKLDRVIDAMVTHEDLRKLEERLETRVDKRFAEVMQSIDGLTKVIHDLTMEYTGIKMQLSRHEEWFKIIAKEAGIKLPI